MPHNIPHDGPLTLLLGEDRHATLQHAQNTYPHPTYTPQDGGWKAADISSHILPTLRQAGPAHHILPNIDLAADNLQIKLLKTFESLTEDDHIILTSTTEDHIIPPLLGRCNTIHTIPTPRHPHPWTALGPIAGIAATSRGKTADAYHTLATTDLTSGQPALDTLVHAVETVAGTKPARRAGGRAGILDAIIRRAETESATQLRRGQEGGGPDGYRRCREYADRLSAARNALTYHPPTRTLLASIL